MKYDGIRWRALRQVFARRYPDASLAELDRLVEAQEREHRGQAVDGKLLVYRVPTAGK